MTTMTVVGGVHGAGKSTLCRELHGAAAHLEYLTNTDVQRNSDRPLTRAEVHEHLREWVERCFVESTAFVFEHVMSGHFVARLIEGAHAHGFAIHLIYLDLPDVAAAMARVEARVAKGGHDVQRDRITARLHESRENFWTRYRPCASTWELYDASTSRRVRLAHGVGARIEVDDARGLAAFERRRHCP